MQKEVASKIPKHVGIIMDGNGRWATLNGKERSFGHVVGSQNVDRIVTHAFKSGVTTLSLYAFSSENWNRPKKEVDALMDILTAYFTNFLSNADLKGVRLIVSGDLSVLPKQLKEIIDYNMQQTISFKDKFLNIAINYGGRQEIVYAVKNLIKENREITTENISSALYTAEFGEPDLIIRTGGEKRISNFMLFQGAYSEFYFTDVLWPDFNGAEFDKALLDYSKRKRRFGVLGEENEN